MNLEVLRIEDLRVYYDTISGVVKAVDGVSLSMRKGEILGLAGESGSGKTTMARAIMRLLPSNGRIISGRILLNGIDVVGMSEEEIREIRWKKVSMVFQGAMNALNPVLRVGDQIAEVLIEKGGYSKEEAWARVEELFRVVGIDPARARDYPHEFSGGMRQRAIIAMAIALNPDLVIADEPVTALDVVVQSKILRLLEDLRDKLGISVLLITHDLSVIAEACDRTAIMYAGKLVEYGTTEEVFEEPLHPYTKALISAFPSITGEKRSFEPIRGDPPNMLNVPPGCPFHPRCPKAFESCDKEVPELIDAGNGHLVACHLYGR
ncbi:MAG: ABC transporter ATP-binding protein [Candidatus Korarchaeota archaeon]|nr:ABC transporter ATP-binding protein [Candidatus Korarchaeota archaeon]